MSRPLPGFNFALYIAYRKMVRGHKKGDQSSDRRPKIQ
jgi:hypothetical protein